MTTLVQAGMALAAEKIALACSGSFWTRGSKPPFAELAVPSMSFTIDPDTGIVTSQFGQFGITKSTDASINFEAVAESGGKVVGGFDRYSGFTNLTFWHGKEVTTVYNLNCKRVTPLF